LAATLFLDNNPIDGVTSNTKQILTAAYSHPPGASQRDLLPSNLWIKEECWQFIQEMEVSSSSNYTLTVPGIETDKVYSLPDPTELVVQAYFSNDQLLLISFRHNLVVDCWIQESKQTGSVLAPSGV
jgi:hypothetical protein